MTVPPKKPEDAKKGDGERMDVKFMRERSERFIRVTQGSGKPMSYGHGTPPAESNKPKGP